MIIMLFNVLQCRLHVLIYHAEMTAKYHL